MKIPTPDELNMILTKKSWDDLEQFRIDLKDETEDTLDELFDFWSNLNLFDIWVEMYMGAVRTELLIRLIRRF